MSGDVFNCIVPCDRLEIASKERELLLAARHAESKNAVQLQVRLVLFLVRCLHCITIAQYVLCILVVLLS